MNINYLHLILKGYYENRDFLDKHFYREYKEAEKNHIEYIEFFTHLMNSISLLTKDRDSQYYKRLTEVAMIRNMRESNGKPTDDLEDQTPQKENYWVNLFYFTGGAFIGNLGTDEINYISSSVKLAWDRVKAEKLPEPEKKLELSSIFNSEDSYKTCLEILDINNASELTQKKGYILFAIIDLFKEKSQKYLTENFSDEYLLKIFNTHLGKEYKQIKRNSPGFIETKNVLKKNY